MKKRTIKKISLKFRKLSRKNFIKFRKNAKIKAMAGSALFFIPGSMTTFTTYKLSKKLVNSYKEFKKIASPEKSSFTKFFLKEIKSDLKGFKRKFKK